MSPRIELETGRNEGGALTNCACTLPPTLVFKNYPLMLCSHVSDFILRTEIFCSELAHFSHVYGENDH